MQKIATQVFMCASVVFGATGILMVLTSSNGDDNSFLARVLAISVFVILPSFALSVAGKFLSTKP